MVIFRITKEMPGGEYLEYSRRLVQQYEWCKERDKCMVVPECVDIFIVDTEADPLVIDKLTTEDLDMALKKALEKLYEKPDKIYSYKELLKDLPEIKPE